MRNEQVDGRIETDNGIFRSLVLPGLWLDADAMLAGNLARVLEVLQQGIASPDHSAFCERLRLHGAGVR